MSPSVNAFDRDDFDPALVALLGMWRKALLDSPDEATLRWLHDDMPAELKAFLLTVAYKGGTYYVTLPSSLPVAEWRLDSEDLTLLDRSDPDSAESFENLGCDSLLQIGCEPGGHVCLYAGWNAGDATFRLVAWASDYGEAYTVGTMTDLLKQAIEGRSGKQEDRLRWTLDGFAREWIAEARALGAGVEDPPPDEEEEKPPVTLNTAASGGDVEACRALLDAGADVNARSSEGATALIDAIVAGKPGWEQVVDLLLERGADPNLMNDSGEASGFFAINFRNSDKVLQKLLARGLNPNIKGQKGRTIISWAGASGNLAALEVLAAHGAELNATDTEGHFPLTHVIQAKKPDAVRRLLELGADAAAFNDGWGPIFQAAHIGDLESARLLVEKGADPHVTGHGDKTAAEWAKRQRHTEIVALFGGKK